MLKILKNAAKVINAQNMAKHASKMFIYLESSVAEDLCSKLEEIYEF